MEPKSEIDYSSLPGRMEQFIQEVLKFDADHGIIHENEHNMHNLAYNALALSGEVGEVLDRLEVIQRQVVPHGMRLEWRDDLILKQQIEEELVDVMIYLCKLIVVSELEYSDFELQGKAQSFDVGRAYDACMCFLLPLLGIANIVKKMWRDGVSDKYMVQLQLHIETAISNFPQVVYELQCNFGKSWRIKHKALYARWKERNIGGRKEILGGEKQ